MFTICSCQTSLLKNWLEFWLIPGKVLSSFVAFSPGVRAFFPKYLVGDSIKINTRVGSEAMEGAVKLARQVSTSFSGFGSSPQ